MTRQLKDNPRYAVTLKDIKTAEEQCEAIPEGAFVALRSAWSKQWPRILTQWLGWMREEMKCTRMVTGSLKVYL